MVAKYRLTRFDGFFLVSTIAVLACLGAVSAATDSEIINNSATSHRSLRVTHLWISTWTTANEDTYESRVIDISGVKDLVKKGTQNLKKLAESATLKLVSKNQQVSDKLFTRLKVDKVESKLLDSNQFQRWANSVTKSYKNNLEVAEVAMASTLAAHYGDGAVAKLLVAASNVERTKDMAKRLEGGLLTNWIVNEWSADDVFTLLKLDKEGVKMFGSPVWSTWTSYLLRLDKENPGQLMLRVLKGYYGDEKLAKTLSAAMQYHRTREVARNLEKIQRSSWLSNGKRQMTLSTC